MPREGNMKRRSVIVMGLFVAASAIMGCANPPSDRAGDGWITLFDGSSLDQWNHIGNANWTIADGAVQSDKGTGFLVSKNKYANFEIRAEFWADADANSGIFIRCSDPRKITSENAYEVNIFDKRPDPSYATGAIVGIAKSPTIIKAAGRWNTYDITAIGDRFTVTLNGIRTVDGVRDGKHASGPIALQRAGGVIKFRKVEIRPL